MKELFTAYWKFTRNMENGIRNHGLNSGNPKVILYLLSHEGCRQKDVARECCVESATLSTVLANMEDNDLIERKRLDGNRRSYAIYLTDKGRRAFDVVKRQLDATSDTAFSGFSEEEIEQLRSYLCRITENLNG